MREDQQEHQQQMMEILEKVSTQVKKVENIGSQSVPALEGEYYTPPVSQMRMNTPGKFSAPPNLPTFLGTGTRTQYRRANQSMPLPGGGCSSNPQRGSSQISHDRVHQGSSPWTLKEFIGYGDKKSVIHRHIKE